MPSSEHSRRTPREALQGIWDKPAAKRTLAVIGGIAAIAKILEYLVAPQIPIAIKAVIWVLVIGCLLPFLLQLVALGVRRIAQDEIQDYLSPDSQLVDNGRNETARVAYASSCQLYGMSYETLITHCTILDDGSAFIRREMDLVAYTEVSTMDHYLLFPEASGQEKPRSKPQVELVSGSAQLTETTNLLSSGKTSLTVSINPELYPEERMRYAIREQSAPGLYAITGKEPRKTPDEYFAWDISRPTQDLEIKVLFPSGFEPRACQADVWYAVGQSRSSHEGEKESVRDLLRHGREGEFRTLSLHVTYPILGLTYVIKWWPPHPGPVEAE